MTGNGPIPKIFLGRKGCPPVAIPAGISISETKIGGQFTNPVIAVDVHFCQRAGYDHDAPCIDAHPTRPW